MTRPLLLGHRGARASRQVPENTLASFELCLQHGCDGFEFDVRRSAGGELVICHDATSNGIEIETAPSQELSLPTLDDVLRQFSHRAFLDIELKVAGTEARAIDALRQCPPLKGYVVSSFLPAVLTAMRDLDAAIPLGFLCETPDQLQGWPETPAEWVITHADLTSRPLIDQIHAAGKRVMVWTVNTAEQIRGLAAWGVDALIFDETERLPRTLR